MVLPQDKRSDAPKKEQSRIFRVIKGAVGPFPPNHKFSEAEFKRLNPLPKDQSVREQMDVDTYHDDLLERLTTLGVISEAPGETPDVTPLGPESGVNVGKPIRNPTITNAVKEELERQKAVAAAKAEKPAEAPK